MLAIVIPYFKLTFFEATLQSLANQTDKRFRVYIGDDASPENPSVLLEKFKGKFDFVCHRFDSNLGGTSLTQQWERCVALSGEEEWLMILGDDDVFGENVVAAFYNHLREIEQLNIDVVRFSTVVVNQDDEKISIIHTHPKLEKATDFLMRKFRGGTRSSLSEFIFKKANLLQVRFKDLPLAWYSDVLAFLEVSNFNLIYTINEAIVSFRLSKLNITSKEDNLTTKNVATFEFYYYLLYYKKDFFDLEQRAILFNRLEKTFLDNKKNVYFWIQMAKLYLVNFLFVKYLVFIGSIVESVYKKHNT
jgi:glycosyltransferase involved in cell wall biosynthesis